MSQALTQQTTTTAPPVMNTTTPMQSTYTGQAQGAAATTRIANDDGISFDQALIQQLGPLAAELDLSKDRAALDAMAKSIVDDLKADTTLTSIEALTAKLEKELVQRAAEILSVLPDGKEISQKFSDWGIAHPDIAWAAILLAAVGSYMSDFGKIPAVSHTFKLGDTLSTQESVNFGQFHDKLIQSVKANLKWTKGALSVSGGVQHSFAKGTNQYSLQLSDNDIELIHQKISATVDYTHTTGTKPSDAITTAIKDAQLQVRNNATWSSSGFTDSVQEMYTSKKIGNGWAVQGTATETFGAKRPADNVGLGVTFPAVGGVVVTLADSQAVGTGAGAGVNTQTATFVINDKLTVTLTHGDANQDNLNNPSQQTINSAASGDDIGGGSFGKTFNVTLKFKF